MINGIDVVFIHVKDPKLMAEWYMKTLDLHGTKHHQVETLVENFVLREDLPVRIVTGNSPAMKGLVEKILDENNLSGESEHYYNLGAIIVKEKRDD